MEGKRKRIRNAKRRGHTGKAVSGKAGWESPGPHRVRVCEREQPGTRSSFLGARGCKRAALAPGGHFALHVACAGFACHVIRHASPVMVGNDLLSPPTAHLQGLSSGDRSGTSSHSARGALEMGKGDYRKPGKHQKAGMGLMMAQKK